MGENAIDLTQLKIIALNVNSLIKMTRRHNLNNFLCENKPDFMLISETKLKNIHKLSFPNYEVHRNDRLTDAGGGTAVICVNNYKTERIFCDKNITSFKYTMVRVFLNNNESVYVIAIYKPPSIQIKTNELDILINECGQSKFILGGDFNAKHKSWRNIIDEYNGIKNFEWLNEPNNKISVSMLTGNEQTCYRSNNSFIDLFIFRKSILNSYSYVTHNQLNVIPYFSDHKAIVFSCIIESSICKKKVPYKYIYKNVEWNKINKNIEKRIDEMNVPTSRNLTPNEIDSLASGIQLSICEVIDKHLKKVPAKENNFIDESAQTKVENSAEEEKTSP